MINKSNKHGVTTVIGRDSNLELLRILAMLLIVSHHFAVHSKLPLSSANHVLSVNLLFSQLLAIGGKIGVNLFVLITGYYLINKTFKVTSFMMLWVNTIFYSLSIYAIFVVTGRCEVNLSVFIYQLFPISFKQYWFITCYFVLLLISPFINILLINLSQRQHQILIILSIILYSLPNTLFVGLNYNFFYYTPLVWFFILYCISSYARLYVNVDNYSSVKCFAISLSAFLVIFIFTVSYALMIRYNIHFVGNWFLWAKENSLFALICSVATFLLFCKINVGSVRWINSIASTMLGVYLIHDNNLVRSWLWGGVVHASKKIDSAYYILWAFGVILLIFLICSMIDFLRGLLLGPLLTRLLKQFKWADDKVKLIFPLYNAETKRL